MIIGGVFIDGNLFFLGALVLGIVGAVWMTWGKGEAAFKAVLQQFEQRGYAITVAYEKNRGHVTWVWGRYSQPVPWYLHFSNRYPELSAVGQLGVADMKVGHVGFDKDFYLRTNKPEWALQFFTPQRCDELVGYEDIQFLTSAVGQILTPDYWPDLKAANGRNLRDVWMLRISGKPQGAELDRYVALALKLKTEVQAYAQARSGWEAADLEVKGFEGR